MADGDRLDGADLLESLETIGIHLWLEDSTLRYRAPKGVMTPERLADLRTHRDQVVAQLRAVAGSARISHDEAGRFQPFPLTEVQSAYLAGRGGGFPYGGVGCHGYGELRFDEADPERLDAAWQVLTQRHDMLRATVLADGSQHVLEDPPDYHIGVRDLGAVTPGEFAAAVEATRAEMDHRVYQPGEWPLFDLRLTRSGDSAILHFSLDFLIADFVSIQLLLTQLEQEYAQPGSAVTDLDITFRDVVLAGRLARSENAAQRDRAYWWDRIDDLPGPPELPVTGTEGQPRFSRLAATLDARGWARFQQRARAAGLTPSSSVLAAYAEVLRRWSRQPGFTLNVTVLNRPAVHPQIRGIVGDFTSVELLAVPADEGGPFRRRAAAVQARLFEDLDHGLCSGLEVLRELRKRRADGLAILPCVFTSSIGLRGENLPAGTGLGRLVGGISQTPQVWLDCQVMEGGDGLAFNWDVRQGIFRDGVAEAMFGAFTRLLHDLAASDDAWQAACPVPVPANQFARRPGRQSPAADGEVLLHGRFLAQAAENPHRTAVVAGSRSISYGDLLAQSAAVARALDERGCARGSVVAIEMDKGWEQIPAVIGTLMHGCAYVPVDTSQPVSRRDRILADVGAGAVLTQSRLAGAASRPRQVEVDELAASLPLAERVPAGSSGTDLAYVIYTSGSTGAPKGVMISHQAALNTIEDINRRFGIQPDDRVLGLANLGFDLSVYDIFGLLSVGGCLVLPDADRRGDPAHWAELIEVHGVTLWNSVPAQLEMLMAFLRSGTAADLTTLRLAFLSGDWIPLSLPEAVWERLPALRLISLGGATEASIWSIFHPVDSVDHGLPSIPYGTPLAGQTVQVLGHDLNDLPDLAVGEIWIGGAGLSDGYLGDADQTARRFRRHPVTGERLYRTGDLGRYLPDGEIEFLGREDSQVKIRGHRVELAEVETALAAHPDVRSAAVIAAGQRPDPIRLAAFVEPADAAGPAATATAAGLGPEAVAGAAALRAGVDADEMLAFAHELDATALLQMLATLRGAGLFTGGQASHSLPEILERAQVAPRHHRLVRRWLRALLDNQLIRQDPATGCYHGAADADAELVAAGWQRVERLLPAVERRTELLGYFRTTADNLPGLLSGELDPLTLLFPEGRTEIHEVAYTAMFLSRYLNRLLTTAACSLAGQHAGPEPFRVLEVGAGVGGTSVELIPALAAFDVEYQFTDVSEFFLNNARQRFAQYPWVSYGRYDMNRDYRPQGLLPNSCDMVVCANVLHYAHNVDEALARLRELVRPGGWILFLEATRDSYQIMTSMEFLFDESSGEFTDVRRLREQTFANREQWLRVLADAHADDTLCLPENDPITDQMGMHFFAARFKSGAARISRQDLERHLTGQLPDHMLPAQLQVVDRLPLSANAKVDRKTLRSWLNPGQTGAGADVGEPPAGPAEERIAAVWQRLLPADQIGRHQNFFELGGDSLLAAQVASETRQSVPEAASFFYDDLLRLILQNATVASLAAEIGRHGTVPRADDGPTAPASPIVRLAPGEGLTVLVHDGTGRLAGYGPILDSLPAGGVAGLAVPDPAAYLKTPAADLIDEIAASYTRALLADRCDRLRLAGRGLGGVLAAEVARQLAEAGASVEALVLIAAAPAAPPGIDDATAELMFWREAGVGPEQLGQEPPGAALAEQGTGGPHAAETLEWLRSQPREDRFRRLASAIPGGSPEEAYEVFRHTMDAAGEHELLPYAGDITLIRPPASVLWPWQPAELETLWRDVCLGDLRVIDVAGGQPGYLHEAAVVLPGLLGRPLSGGF